MRQFTCLRVVKERIPLTGRGAGKKTRDVELTLAPTEQRPHVQNAWDAHTHTHTNASGRKPTPSSCLSLRRIRPGWLPE